MKQNTLVWIPARVVYNGLDGHGVAAGKEEKDFKRIPPQVLLVNSDQPAEPADQNAERLERVDWLPDNRVCRLEYLEEVEMSHHLMCEEINAQLSHTMRGKVSAFSPAEGVAMLLELLEKHGIINKSDIQSDAAKQFGAIT